MAGFNHDERPLWLIPEAVELMVNFDRCGGLSVLKVSGVDKQSAGVMPSLPPMGAFEMWVMLNGLAREDLEGSRFKATKKRFCDELLESNERMNVVCGEA
ncbi:MAG: hypothetical protein AB7I36_20985 [Rhodospirillaceae bacterium]